jgi:hypothetical protein
MQEDMTLLEFQKRFETEESCLDYLEKLRWRNGFHCPNCSHDVGYRIVFRRLIQCAVCRHQSSVTAGTVFHKTRTPLRHWFWIMYMMSHDKGGTAALRLAQQLGMHYSTVWHIVQKVRYAMGKRDDGITLAGFIELDEVIVAREARKTGRRRTDGTKKSEEPRLRRLGARKTNLHPRTQCEVIVMVEQMPGRAGNIAMKIVQRTTRDDLREFIERQVEESNHCFRTDGAQSHAVVQSMGHCLHFEKMGGALGSERLPILHRAAALLKRFLMGTYHGVSAKYLQPYLQEFCFRFNRRDKQNSIATSLLRACIFAVPITYAELKL